MANLIEFSAKLVEMAARNKQVPLTLMQVKDIATILGISDTQFLYYEREFERARVTVWEGQMLPHQYHHEILEYVHAVLESKL